MIESYDSATVDYLEGEPGDEYEVKHEGGVDIHNDWVVLRGPGKTWIPRERVVRISLF